MRKFLTNGLQLALLSVFFQLTFTSILQAQAPPLIWGIVPDDDLAMTSYALDPDADKVVLCSYGTTTLVKRETSDDLEVIYTRHIRMKVLTEEGAEDASIRIPYHKKEKIFKFKAQTINAGETSEVRKDDIFDEKLEGSRYYRKFAFPDVQVGSILEYKYSYSSPFPAIPDSWYFQKNIPVKWSECRFTLPEHMEYVQVSRVAKPYDIKEVESRNTRSFGVRSIETTFRFVLKDLPAMEEESFITTMDDYRSMIQFQLARIDYPSPPYSLGTETEYMTNWPDLIRRWMKMESGGRQIKYKANHKKILNEAKLITEGIKDKEKEMEALFNFIRDSYSWDGNFWQLIEEKNLSTAFENKAGNSATINMSLLACLRAADIEAYPVLLSTRDNGKLQKVYPMIQQFDHVIVLAKVNGKEFLLDAIDKELSPNMIHPQSLNKEGLLVDEDLKNPAWITLPPQASDELVNINLKLDGDESQAEFTGVYKGYRARYKRKSYKNEKEEDYIENRLGDLYDFEVEDAEFQNADKPGKRFIEKMTLTVTDAVDKSGDNIYINPLLMEQTEERVFSLKNRTYPVDIAYPYVEKYILNFDIPKGYEVVSTPENMKLELIDGDGSYLYLVEVKGERIQLRCEERLNKPVFQPEEYDGLKEFFDKIFDKEGEQIVLKKI